MSTPTVVDRWLNERKDLITLKHVADNGGYSITLDSVTAPKWITRSRFSPNVLFAMTAVSAVMEHVGGTWERVTA